MAVRTKSLATGRLATSSVVSVYVAEADETTIVKEIRVTNLSTSATAVVSVLSDAGAFADTLVYEVTLAARGSDRRELWWVLKPGMEISLQGPGTPAVNYWISGTELEGVAD